MDTETVFPEGSFIADMLHSSSTVESPRFNVTLVSDSFLGNGPGETQTVNLRKIMPTPIQW